MRRVRGPGEGTGIILGESSGTGAAREEKLNDLEGADVAYTKLGNVRALSCASNGSVELLDQQRLVGQIVDHADEREVEPVLEHGERSVLRPAFFDRVSACQFVFENLAKMPLQGARVLVLHVALFDEVSRWFASDIGEGGRRLVFGIGSGDPLGKWLLWGDDNEQAVQA